MSAQPEMLTMYVHRTHGNTLSLPGADSIGLGDVMSIERVSSDSPVITQSAVARAYDLIVGLRLFRVDERGAGGVRGVQAFSPTINSPERMVVLRDEMSAMWLRRHFEAKGVRVRMLWVG
jgi:hypothetical protein